MAMQACCASLATPALPMLLRRSSALMEYAASGQARLGYATWHDSCMRTIACTAGSRPAIVRAMAVNLGELATYDTAKQASLRTGFMSLDGVFLLF